VAVAIEVQRSLGRLRRDDTVLVIDLDAHRGNGFESIAHDDPAVRVLDIYNFQIYPGLRPGEPDQHPFSIPVPSHTGSNDYLDIVREELARFLDAAGQPRLAFYNAGTDVVEGDPLGRMRVSEPAVAERDRYVVDTLAPT
jgi:histone deacetylase 11